MKYIETITIAFIIAIMVWAFGYSMKVDEVRNQKFDECMYKYEANRLAGYDYEIFLRNCMN